MGTGDGRVMLWDLSISSIDPVSIYRWTWIPRSTDQTGGKGTGINIGEESVSESINNPEDGANKSLYDEDDEASGSFGKFGRDLGEGFLPPLSSEYTCIEFMEGAPLLVAGDSFGTVTCFRINAKQGGNSSAFSLLDGIGNITTSTEIQGEDMENGGSKLMDILYPSQPVGAE